MVAPSETRIRTLVEAIGAGRLAEVIGGWLLTAIAIIGKRLRGVLDGQVKLFAAMPQQEVIFGQVRVPDETTEVT